MLPEISRRCVSCGAAVRASARFCPQCGKGVTDGDAGRADVSPGASASATREPESPRATAPTTKDLHVAAESESPQGARVADAARLDAGPQGLDGDGARVFVPEPEARRAVPETGEVASPYGQAATPTAPAATQTAQTSTPNAQAATTTPVQAEDAAASEERRSRVARVREGTRARVENTRARVERVKDDALVALEETPDDSGLRFVAVAVVLFVLFLGFLFLSVTVLR